MADISESLLVTQNPFADSDWTVKQGAGLTHVDSGYRRTSGGIGNVTFNQHNTALATDDHDVSCVITKLDSTMTGGLYLRYDPTADTGYQFMLRPSAGSINVYHFTGTTRTVIAVNQSSAGVVDATATGSYTYRVTIEGTTLTAYINGTQFWTDTDATYSTGKYVGMGGGLQIGSNDYGLNTWEATALNAGTSIPIFAHHYRQLASAG